MSEIPLIYAFCILSMSNHYTQRTNSYLVKKLDLSEYANLKKISRFLNDHRLPSLSKLLVLHSFYVQLLCVFLRQQLVLGLINFFSHVPGI